MLRIWPAKTIALLSVVTLVLGLAGCAGKSGDTAGTPSTAPAAASSKMIQSVGVEDGGDASRIRIEGSTRLTYMSVKQPSPPGVILYFEGTGVEPGAVPTFSSDRIASIEIGKTLDNPTTARAEIRFHQDMPYNVRTEGNVLVIETAGALAASEESVEPVFEARAVVPEKTEPIEAATRILDVASEVRDGQTVVRVRTNGTVEGMRHFTIANKPRIVVDMPRLSSPFTSEQKVDAAGKAVNRIRHFASAERFRLVLDTPEASLENYSVVPVPYGLEVRVGGKSAAPKKGAGETIVAPVASEAGLGMSPGEQAVLTSIDFTALPNGKSKLVLGTNGPVDYDIDPKDGNRVVLTLKDTRVPAYNRHPIITTRFESALDRVLPVERMNGTPNAALVMELRERVPYLVEQQENRIEIQFEASGIAPRAEESAGLAPWQTALEETILDAPALPPQPEPAPPVVAADGYSSTTVDGDRKVYTGTPISLDFYETDIKNVFRILQSISGRNFAIDKDVSGKVTMSLEHPVPWDQILDLVLRMNGLGTVEEGNILRIATLETLRQEENIRNEVIRARKANEAEQKNLEPLMTEYLLINYSDAGKEIMPHIEKLLSDRGSVTVDVRNNQLILTDTAEIVEKSRILIERIDKITPQVVIEARIVEATSQFSKSLGTDWDISTNAGNANANAAIYKNVLGGNYGYNANMNLAGGQSNIGLNFARINGSPLVINATLNAMETQREGKIISSPRVVTLDNKKATITQGVEYPYSTTNAKGDAVVQFKNIELKLEVTPHVTADNRISLLVKIDKNDIDQQTASGPSLATNKVETELLVNDGDTIVIGGILKTTRTDTENMFPLLGRIPVIGWLFKSREDQTRKDELLIFMTPRISELENSLFS